MSTTKAWLAGALLGAAAVLGFGLIVPSVTACSSSTGEETEQVEQSDGGEDLEESEPEPDIEE